MCDFLRPHGLQHARLPCPSLSPGVCSNSSSLSWWCYLTISSSDTLFSFCLQSFPALGSFLMSWLLVSDGQIIGASALVSVLPMDIQDWFPLGLTDLSTNKYQFSLVQSLSHVWLFVTPSTAMHQASLSFTISWSLLKFVSMESAMPSNHRILCRCLLLLPSVFPSVRVFSSESALHIRWPQYWSFGLSIGPPSEHSGLTSFKWTYAYC